MRLSIKNIVSNLRKITWTHILFAVVLFWFLEFVWFGFLKYSNTVNFNSWGFAHKDEITHVNFKARFHTDRAC